MFILQGLLAEAIEGSIAPFPSGLPRPFSSRCRVAGHLAAIRRTHPDRRQPVRAVSGAFPQELGGDGIRHAG